MKCPHCSINFHDNWAEVTMSRHSNLVAKDTDEGRGYWHYRSAICAGCREYILQAAVLLDNEPLGPWQQFYPIGANRGPVSPEVPASIKGDYVEACNVLPISPKASAALSRRCLQNMLHSSGYPGKALPHRLRVTVDAIRNFGNFSAHPINDKTTLQVIDVEPEEAEWCLEVIEELFEHFYVGPTMAAAKKAALDAKLVAAGKPRSK